MNQFFEQFRQNMARRPDPEFEERDWLALQKRLDQDKPKRRVLPLLLWWIAGPLLLLSTAFNAVLWRQTQASGLATQVRHDTVYITRVVRQTDTVHITRYLRLPAFAAETPVPVAAMPVFQPAAPETPDPSLAAGPAATAFAPQHLPEANLLSAPIDSLIRPVPELSPVPPVTLRQLARKKAAGHGLLFGLRPKSYAIGVSGGWATPLHKNLHPESGYSFGLSVQAAFSPNVQLWADVGYSELRFLSSVMDESLGIPPIDAPADGFVFAQAELPAPTLQCAAGLQYTFLAGRPLQPLLALGYGAVYRLPYELTYDFVKQPDGIEWSIDQSVARRGWQGSFWMAQAGLAYAWNPRWQCRALLTYRDRLGTAGLQAPRVLVLQGGVFRVF